VVAFEESVFEGLAHVPDVVGEQVFHRAPFLPYLAQGEALDHGPDAGFAMTGPGAPHGVHGRLAGFFGPYQEVVFVFLEESAGLHEAQLVGQGGQGRQEVRQRV